MKLFFILLITGVYSLLNFFRVEQRSIPTFSLSYHPVAVVELFTSQGCSSCPPADELFGKLIAAGDENVLALAFHVDYWNRLGWKDPFSKQIFTERQQQYALRLRLNSAYTPQMIVNGRTEFVGSNSAALTRAIKNALAKPATVRISSLKVSNPNVQEIQINYLLDGDFEKSMLHAALIKKSKSTKVTRGENGGRLLTNHNVVHSFFSVPAAATGQLRLIMKDIETDDAQIVLFVQKVNGEITGAIKAILPGS